LQRNLDFEFEEVDITFRPDLIREKGFRSVPIIEVDGRFWVGNATSAQLAAFLTGNE
jgi:glutaredoxin